MSLQFRHKPSKQTPKRFDQDPESLRKPIGLLGLALLTMAAFALLPASVEKENGIVLVTSPRLMSGIAILALLSGIAFFLRAMIGSGRDRLRWPLFFVFVPLLTYPTSCATHVVRNLAPWRLGQSVSDHRGTQYVYAESSFLQGQRLSIARVQSKNLFWTQIQILGTTNGDSPRIWASVLRPELAAGDAPDSRNGYGQLYCTDTNIVLGFRYGTMCYMMFDTNTGTFTGNGFDQMDTSASDISEVHPFICLAPGDQFRQEDLNELLSRIDEAHLCLSPDRSDVPEVSGVPRRHIIEPFLEDPNPAIADAADQIIVKLDKLAAAADKFQN